MADPDWEFELEDLELDDGNDASLEPGSPTAEGAFFVVLGAAVTVASFAALFLF